MNSSQKQKRWFTPHCSFAIYYKISSNPMAGSVNADISLRCCNIFLTFSSSYWTHSCFETLRIIRRPSPIQVSDNMNECLFGVCLCLCLCGQVCAYWDKRERKHAYTKTVPVLSISPHTSLSLNLSSKSSLSFSMVFNFSFKLDTSDISSSFWVSSAVLQRSSYNDKWRLLQRLW